jgi:hypothetical protein
MRLNYLWMALLIGVCILCGCGSDDSAVNPESIPVSKVTFLDKGPIVPDTVTVTVAIKLDSIEYISQNSGGIINQWSKKIELSDFMSVQQIINQYKLFQSDDVTLPDGAMPCTGWSGMMITIDSYNSSHSFDIAGAVCSKTQWPEGVQALVNLKDELIAKYE